MNPTEKLMALQIDSLEIIERAYINFKKSPKERITLGYVQGRLEALENYFREFRCMHERIVTSVSKEDKDKLSYFTDEVFDSYEERFYIYKGELKTVLQEFSNEAKSNQNIQGGHGTQPIQSGNSSGHMPISEIKLPRITIPCFSGDYTEWQSFHDLFTSLIHSNDSLDDVQKMHYLKVNLKGDAEVLLRQLPITGENYTQAWTILKKRYDNKRYIANCFFKKFFAQKTIVQESATALKQLLDTSVECLNALKNLGLPTPQWDAIIIYIVVSKLDPVTHKQWEELINEEKSEDFPSFEKLKSFLETRFRTLEMVEPSSKSYKSPQPKTFHVTANDIECAFCKEKHLIHHCKQFSKRQIDERYEFVRDNNLCYNCLIPNHTVWRCKQKTSFQVCKRRHHSLLHRYTTQMEEKQENKEVDMTMEGSKVVAHVRPCGEEEERNILLATALVEVASKCGQPQVCRALIDQGSEASFVTARVVKLLRLKKTAISGAVSGINGHNNVCIKHKVELQITSRYEPDFSVKVNAYVLKSLSNSLPAREINCNTWPLRDNMKLADPTFNTPSRVDILLGADVFGKIIDSGFMRGTGDVVAQYTHLGWILSGNTNTTSSSAHKITSFHVTRQVKENNNLLKKFEEVETKGYTNMKTFPREEELCKEVYKTTSRRDDTRGGIDTVFPLKQSVENTVKSHREIKQQTIGRFEQLEITFNKNKTFKKGCTNATQEYIEMSHIRKAEGETSEKIENNKLLTMRSVFTGTASAPHRTARTLNEFADDENHTYLSAADVVKNRFYVDDLLTGHEDVFEVNKLCHEVNSLLRAGGGSEMQKRSSYSKEQLEFLQDEEGSEESENKKEIELDKVFILLALTWDRNDDVIYLPTSRAAAEREVFSSLFEPLCLLVPIVITAQVVIQRLSLHYSVCCDDELPLQELKGNREVLLEYRFIDARLDGFCQRVVEKKNSVYIILLATETSLKKSAISRLELHATVSMPRVMREMYRLLNISMNEAHVWMDSITVLPWLRLQPNQCPICARVGVLNDIQNNREHDKRQHGQSTANEVDSNTCWTFEQLNNKYGDFRRTTMPGDDSGLTQIFNHRLKDNPKQHILSSVSRLKSILALYLKMSTMNRKPKQTVVFNITELEKVIQLDKYYDYLISSSEMQDLNENKRIKTGQLPASRFTTRRVRVKIKFHLINVFRLFYHE